MRPFNSPERSLGECADFLGAEISQRELIVSGICSDSRGIEIGDVFVALPGANHHGVDFFETALNRGAVAVVTDQVGAELLSSRSREIPILSIRDPRASLGTFSSWFYGDPSQSMTILGVTGTNGKTTTTFLLSQLLTAAQIEAGLIGTIENRIGEESMPAIRTTPESDELQRLLATMKERHCRAVAMEVSSHALVLDRVRGTHFSACAFTNLSQDHLDFHKTMENYFQAKKSLFTSDYTDRALIMVDDEFGKRLFEEVSIPALSLSLDNRKAAWHYTRRDRITNGFEVAIRGEGGILIEGVLPLYGDYNLQNALAAVALAMEAGVDPLLIGRSLEKLRGAPGRLEQINQGQDFLALVDYAHSPDAVTRVLQTVRDFTAGKVIAVLGCGGDRDTSKRALMGQVLKEGSDIAIFTSDNPRSEDPDAILRSMTKGVELSDTSLVITDRKNAIIEAVRRAKAGDTVIILGKGHETGQEIAGIKHPFIDQEVLVEAIVS